MFESTRRQAGHDRDGSLRNSVGFSADRYDRICQTWTQGLPGDGLLIAETTAGGPTARQEREPHGRARPFILGTPRWFASASTALGSHGRETALSIPLMAGYSGTPLPQKLGIKPEHRVAVVDAPAGFARTLGELPPFVAMRTSLLGKELLHVILVFVNRRGALERLFPRAAKRLDPAGGLWVAWPKKASGVATDLTEDVVREIALAVGLVDNKVCAIDGTWSGLRCVYRLEDRPGGKKPRGALARRGASR